MGQVSLLHRAPGGESEERKSCDDRNLMIDGHPIADDMK
jgi:hypothetical protein